MRKKTGLLVGIWVLVTVIWGTFADLQHGHYGAFMGRVVFMGLAAWAGIHVQARMQRKAPITAKCQTRPEASQDS